MNEIRTTSNQTTDEEKRKKAIDLLESWLQKLEKEIYISKKK